MNNRKKKHRKLLQRGVIIGFIAVVLLSLFFSTFYKKMTYVPYTEFLSAVENGLVKEATLSEDTVSFKRTDAKYPWPNTTENPNTEEFKEMLLMHNIKVSNGTSSDDLMNFAMLILMVGMVGAFVFMMLGNSGSDEHYNSATKTGVTFDDIIGLEDIKKELLITIDILKHTNEYKKQGVRIPKGIVLEGEPGNGKTLLAKALAGESGLNFISANAADFGGIIVGKGSNQVKKLFKDGRKNKPCIIFIDEFDSVAEKRKTDGTAASTDDSKTLTAFLNELDGFKNNNEGIFLVVATNRPEVIDSAMIRPGRFDKRYYVTNPNYDERIKLIELYTKGRTLAADVDASRLAWELSGYSCAAIEMLINEAAILSVHAGKEAIDKADLDASITKYMMHGGSANRKITAEKKKIIAYHEAGHAVTGRLLADEKISKISIVPTKSGMGGYTITYDEDEMFLPTLKELENKVKMLYAGRAAEYILGGRDDNNLTTGASNDVEHATAYISHIAEMGHSDALLDYSQFGDCGVEERMEASAEIAGRLWKETVAFAEENWTRITKIAEYLVEHECMDGEQFDRLISNDTESL